MASSCLIAWTEAAGPTDGQPLGAPERPPTRLLERGVRGVQVGLRRRLLRQHRRRNVKAGQLYRLDAREVGVGGRRKQQRRRRHAAEAAAQQLAVQGGCRWRRLLDLPPLLLLGGARRAAGGLQASGRTENEHVSCRVEPGPSGRVPIAMHDDAGSDAGAAAGAMMICALGK